MNERDKEFKYQASVWCDENISEQFSEETNGYGKRWEEKFAELIRADEREECAKVCDAVAEEMEVYGEGPTGYISYVEDCAKAIRARGNI